MDLGFENAFLQISGKLEQWVDDIIELIPNMVLALVLFAIFITLAKITQRTLTPLLKRFSKDLVLTNLFSILSYYAVILIGIIIILEVLHLGKAVTSLLAGVGVLGLALGFAFQDIAANFISGIVLASKKPFEVGDVVEVEGIMGMVDRNNLRVTVIRTFQGQEVYIPNKNLVQSKIINYSATRERRIDQPVGVSYGEDLNRVRQITINAVQNVEGVRTDKEVMLDFYEFDDFSINFYVRYWMHYTGRDDEPGFLSLRNNVVMAIKTAYDKNNITIPFPIRTLDFGIKGGQKLTDLPLKDSFKEKPE